MTGVVEVELKIGDRVIFIGTGNRGTITGAYHYGTDPKVDVEWNAGGKGYAMSPTCFITEEVLEKCYNTSTEGEGDERDTTKQ